MPKMNRRSFLQLLGATATAAIIEPTKALVFADASGLLVTEYSLLEEGVHKISFNVFQHAALVLPAPAGEKCRATLRMPDELKGVLAYTRGVQTFNGPAEVLITHVGRAPISMLAAAVDATIFNSHGDLNPVDWGVITTDRALEFDYEAMGQENEHLFLALAFTAHEEGYSHCPPGSGFGEGGAQS